MAIRGSDAHTVGEYRWRGCSGSPSYWSGAKAVRGELLLGASDSDGYDIRLYDTGRLYTLRISYWRGDRDASKEGYTLDERITGGDWATVRSRALARDVLPRTLAIVESAADEEGVELR